MLLPLGDDLERPVFPVVTVALIFANVAIFALMFRMELFVAPPPGEDLNPKQVERIEEFFSTWGSVPARLADGEVIGVLTHMFIHAGLFHLIGNMLILWVFGQSLETALGGLPFLVLYIFWGALACLAQAAVDFNSEMPLVGASGAIAGVIGGYIAMFGYSARIRMFALIGFFPVRFGVPAIGFGAVWFFQQLYNASIDADGSLSGVAWMAHVGGFAAGAVTMKIFRNQTDRVLVREGNLLVFRQRGELGRPEENSSPEPAKAAIAQAAAPQPQRLACPGCGAVLTEESLIGERLLKCPHAGCGRLAFLDDSRLLTAHA